MPTVDARSDTGMCGPNAVFFEDYIFEAFKQVDGSIIIRCKVCGIAHEKGVYPKHKMGFKCQPEPTKS